MSEKLEGRFADMSQVVCAANRLKDNAERSANVIAHLGTSEEMQRFARLMMHHTNELRGFVYEVAKRAKPKDYEKLPPPPPIVELVEKDVKHIINESEQFRPLLEALSGIAFSEDEKK